MSSQNNVHSFRPKKKGSGPSAIKVIGLVIVGLAIAGLVFSSLLTQGGGSPVRNVFGTYGDRKIIFETDNSFGLSVQSAMANYNISADQQSDFFSLVRYMAWQQAYSSVVFNTAVAYHLAESGYEPSSRQLDRSMTELARYSTNGSFDQNKYLSVSQAVKDSDREFLNEQLTINTWGVDVPGSHFHSRNAIDFFWDMRSRVRTYDYISIPFSDYPDQDILAYAEENPELFTQLPVSRITVSDETQANEVVTLYEEQRADNAEAFSGLASEYSDDAYAADGGSMGLTDYYQIQELTGTENADAVFALGEGDAAGPFETDYGWIIFRADGQSSVPDFEERLDDIRNYMMTNEVGMIEDAILARVRDLRETAVSADSFRDSLTEEGYEVLETPAFPVNYSGDQLIGGSPDSSSDPVLNGASSSDDFWNKIVPLVRIGSVSQPVVLNNSVALFALVSSEEAERPESWDAQVEGTVAQTLETDFRSAVTNDESGLLDDNFSAAYSLFFPDQQG